MREPGVGTNRYAYAANDPINRSDANGHACLVSDEQIPPDECRRKIKERNELSDKAYEDLALAVEEGDAAKILAAATLYQSASDAAMALEIANGDRNLDTATAVLPLVPALRKKQGR